MTCLAGVLMACLAAAGQARSRDRTPDEWRAIARADLKATRDAVIAVHPGWIDRENPAFREWTERGYRAAEVLIPRVVSYDTMMAAVRYYVTGFRDGHFVYSDDSRSDDYRVVTSGWKVDKADGAYRVVAVMPGWPEALPPLGASLMGCDGRTPDAIVREDVAPYTDRRDLPAVRDSLASSLGQAFLAGQELKHCEFEKADGIRIGLEVRYRGVTAKEAWEGLRAPSVHMPARRNAYTFRDGILWIRARNFMLSSEQAGELDAMLKEMTALQGVHRIVFDARGNGGGDSAVGERIIAAATGGLVFDRQDLERLPRVYAQWRVSDVSIRGIDWYIDMNRQRYGSDSERVKVLKALRKRLVQAQQAGQPWVDTPGEPRLTRADLAQRHARLGRSGAGVALITDNNCASACLDFADQVRQIPGMVHLGQTTSSDTVYLEMAGRVALPSGNHLAMPIKVWRNRVRRDGEALVPDIPLNVDMNDDGAVRAATLKMLAPH